MKLLAVFLVCFYLVAAKIFKDDQIGQKAKNLTKNYAIVLTSRKGCGFCKNLGYFDEASNDFANIDFVKLNTRAKKFSEHCKDLGLQKAPNLGSTPMFYLLKRNNGKFKLVQKGVGTGNIKQIGLKRLLEEAK
jgi:hypothetical protein